jgi:hypothetical protein
MIAALFAGRLVRAAHGGILVGASLRRGLNRSDVELAPDERRPFVPAARRAIAEPLSDRPTFGGLMIAPEACAAARREEVSMRVKRTQSDSMVVNKPTHLGRAHPPCVRMRGVNQDVVFLVNDYRRNGQQCGLASSQPSGAS